MFWKVEYDMDWKPICEICGKSFSRVLCHVRQKHSISEREYKIQFGLDLRKWVCSKESRELIRRKTLAQYDISIKKNLIEWGVISRFKKGAHKKKYFSEQSRLRIKEQSLWYREKLRSL